MADGRDAVGLAADALAACVGGIGVFCSPNMAGFNVGDTGTATDQSNLAQGRVLVDGQVVSTKDFTVSP